MCFQNKFFHNSFSNNYKKILWSQKIMSGDYSDFNFQNPYEKQKLNK